MFQHLSFHGWRQFKSVDITLHPRLTILTGANGAGKTTILNLFSSHFGWNTSLVGTPRKRGKRGGLGYYSDVWKLELVNRIAVGLGLETGVDDSSDIEEGSRFVETGVNEMRDIGTLTYTSGMAVALQVPVETQYIYNITTINQQPVNGLHIPSHRPLYSYQQVTNIPTVPQNRNQMFMQYTDITRSRFHNSYQQKTPNYYIKETLISLATFGPGNAVIEGDVESLNILNGFQAVLATILPPSMGFKRIVVRMPEVVLVTESGDFSLDAVSGGVASIIDIAWQIFMYSPESENFVVTIDEPENHLHPELQRSMLVSLLNAFPHVQFIVASHNPFIVGSVPESNVYVLDYDENHRVSSEYLDTANRAGTSNEILRDVLGLTYTIPIWVEKQLEEFVEEFTEHPLTNETFNKLRERMKEKGLEKYVPDTIARIAKESLDK